MMNAMRQAAFVAPAGARNMATLKQISTRLKSVKNIQKITKSMKMVSSAKFKRAEERLRSMRPMGAASRALEEKAGVAVDGKKLLIVTVSSDRGLCGGIHSGLSKAVRAKVAELPADVEYKLVCVGDKTRGILSRTMGKQLMMSANEVGRLPPTFEEATFIAQHVLSLGYAPEQIDVLYNKFKSAVSYAIETTSLPGIESLEGKTELDVFDDLDQETLRCYQEFTLATNIFYAMLQGQAAEQSARMTAMENASSNAGDMIDRLQLTFNRTRQAVITRELIEIISGASALE
jgi:F-type H+-transporting ATPase subunit gamma